jgi:hypothetical protein
MIINWSVDEIINELNKIKRAEGDAYETGFNTVKCKEDLYRILWHVEDLLAKCSTYTGEDEWLRKREKQKTFKALGG